MKAVAVFPTSKQVSIIDHEQPSLASPTQAKLRMLEIGICGTDREICRFDYGIPPRGQDHLIIGHESLGEVVEVGGGVSRVRKGDLVVTMVRRPCPHETCIACRAGRQDFCYTGEFTERGINGAHGFMTEFVVDDEQYMNVVPQALREIGVLVEPLTIAEKALIQLRQILQRLPWAQVNKQNAVVLGAGPVGLLGAMALVVAGFETYVYSRSSLPLAPLVESFGAKYIPAETNTIEQMRAQVGAVDVIYEATGASRLSFEASRALGVNGVFIFTGVPGRKAPIEVDTDLIMRDMVLKNQIIYGTVNAGRDAFEAAIRDLGVFQSRWPEAVKSLITGRYPMNQYQELLLGAPAGIKNVIQLGWVGRTSSLLSARSGA
jgi:threonine dehydrogenase-like Zn-dependent dehydrogenase